MGTRVQIHFGVNDGDNELRGSSLGNVFIDCHVTTPFRNLPLAISSFHLPQGNVEEAIYRPPYNILILCISCLLHVVNTRLHM
jgi:hypothetical protein